MVKGSERKRSAETIYSWAQFQSHRVDTLNNMVTNHKKRWTRQIIHTSTVRRSFCFNPHMWGDGATSTLQQLWFCALAEAWVCQLQTVSATVWCLKSWEPFRGCSNARAPTAGCWLLADGGRGWLQFAVPRTRRKKLDSEVSSSPSSLPFSLSPIGAKGWKLGEGR